MKADDLFAQVTHDIIAAIEEGTGSWVMPWHTLAEHGPAVSVDGRPYRGLNALWLPFVAAQAGYTTNVWGTYKSWQKHDAQVQRGEKGTQVVLWKPVPVKDEVDATGKPKTRLIARTFTVFNLAQVAGDGADQIAAKHAPIERDTPERITEAEAYFATVGAQVVEGGNRAYYSPSADDIHVPGIAQFSEPANFYGTLAHEHIHWTGHVSRLDRDLTGRFGSESYGAEELVAELGAAMWTAQAGLSATTRPDHAAYLASWLRVLKADPKALVTVTSKAQAAVDHLNERAGVSAVTADLVAAASITSTAPTSRSGSFGTTPSASADSPTI